MGHIMEAYWQKRAKRAEALCDVAVRGLEAITKPTVYDARAKELQYIAEAALQQYDELDAKRAED